MSDDRGPVAVRPLRKPGSLPPLFLVAAPGVNALGYVALARHLRPEESPFAVEGRGSPPAGREYEPAEIATLASDYLAAIRERQPEGPYFFAGMCDGAHVAFEMARRIVASGERVGMLAMLDTWPVENSSRRALVMVEALRKRVARLPSGQRMDWVRRAAVRVARALGGRLAGRTPEARSPELQRWQARAWPGPSFVPPVYEGRITVVRTQRQAYFRVRDRSLGWASRCREVDVRVVPGRHERLLRRPFVVAVAGALEEALAEARSLAGVPPARVEIVRLA